MKKNTPVSVDTAVPYDENDEPELFRSCFVKPASPMSVFRTSVWLIPAALLPKSMLHSQNTVLRLYKLQPSWISKLKKKRNMINHLDLSFSLWFYICVETSDNK